MTVTLSANTIISTLVAEMVANLTEMINEDGKNEFCPIKNQWKPQKIIENHANQSRVPHYSSLWHLMLLG